MAVNAITPLNRFGKLANDDGKDPIARRRAVRSQGLPALQLWINERRVTLEIFTSIRRAGADMILTYHARDVARWLR